MSKRPLHIGIRVDGILRDVASQFAKYATQVRNVDVKPEDFHTWGFPNVRDSQGRKLIVDVFANPAVGKYIYEKAPPIENAFTGFRMFVKNPNINVYIVSSPKKGYEKFTDTWLEQYSFIYGVRRIFYERNIIDAPVQLLITERPNDVVKYSQNKRDSILMNRPHNLQVEFPMEVARVDDMIDAYRYVIKRYERYI